MFSKAGEKLFKSHVEQIAAYFLKTVDEYNPSQEDQLRQHIIKDYQKMDVRILQEYLHALLESLKENQIFINQAQLPSGQRSLSFHFFLDLIASAPFEQQGSSLPKTTLLKRGAKLCKTDSRLAMRFHQYLYPNLHVNAVLNILRSFYETTSPSRDYVKAVFAAIFAAMKPEKKAQELRRLLSYFDYTNRLFPPFISYRLLCEVIKNLVPFSQEDGASLSMLSTYRKYSDYFAKHDTEEFMREQEDEKQTKLEKFKQEYAEYLQELNDAEISAYAIQLMNLLKSRSGMLSCEYVSTEEWDFFTSMITTFSFVSSGSETTVLEKMLQRSNQNELAELACNFFPFHRDLMILKEPFFELHMWFNPEKSFNAVLKMLPHLHADKLFPFFPVAIRMVYLAREVCPVKEYFSFDSFMQFLLALALKGSDVVKVALMKAIIHHFVREEDYSEIRTHPVGHQFLVALGVSVMPLTKNELKEYAEIKLAELKSRYTDITTDYEKIVAMGFAFLINKSKVEEIIHESVDILVGGSEWVRKFFSRLSRIHTTLLTGKFSPQDLAIWDQIIFVKTPKSFQEFVEGHAYLAPLREEAQDIASHFADFSRACACYERYLHRLADASVFIPSPHSEDYHFAVDRLLGREEEKKKQQQRIEQRELQSIASSSFGQFSPPEKNSPQNKSGVVELHDLTEQSRLLPPKKNS